MKKLLMLAALGLTTITAVAPASAQVDRREDNQQHRIRQGIRSGALTPQEARRLERQQARIDRSEDRLRARNGGYLTPRERARLAHRQAHASRAIYRAKHNGRVDY